MTKADIIDPITISAICPIRDEAENVVQIFKNFRPLGGKTEVILVEGGSTDNSWKVAQKLDRINKYGVIFRAIKQKGRGKAEAVVTGFNQAQGKYLIIVDADMTVPQPDLKKILKLFTQHGDNIIACGNRLIGLPKPKSFYWINYVGNYFFRYYYSLILQTKVADIACGSKAMTKETWNKLKKVRTKMGKIDSWGDMDWLYFGLKVGCQLKFAQVRYTERLLGESKLKNLVIRYTYALKMILIGLEIVKLNHNEKT